MTDFPRPYREHFAAAVRCIALLVVTMCHRFDGSSDLLDMLLVGGAIYALLTTFHPLRWQQRRVVSGMVVADVGYITVLIGASGQSQYMLLYYLPIMLASIRLEFRETVGASLLAAAGLALVVLLRGQSLSAASSPLMQVYLFAGSALVTAVTFWALKHSTVRQQEVASRLEAALERLAAVHEVARAGHGPDGLKKLCETTAALAVRLVGADYGYLALSDPGGSLTVQAVHMERRPESHIAFDPQVANHCVVQMAPVTKHVHWQGKDEYTVGAVPLVTAGQPLGVLEVIRGSHRPLKGREVELLTALCGEASSTIESARLRDEVYALAAVDRVSGLYIEEEFKRLVSQTVHEGTLQPLAMLVFVLDGSSETASAYGEAALEEQVTVFADVVRRGLRNEDLAGRLGRDEFGVLLLNCNTDGARAVASRLRQAFSRRMFYFEAGGNPVTATVCCGIAAIGPGEAPEDPLSLLNRAAGALSLAKEQGPNQIRMWEPPERCPSGGIQHLLSGPQNSAWK